MYKTNHGNRTPYNNRGKGNDNSYGVDGNEGNGKGNLNPIMFLYPMEHLFIFDNHIPL